MPIIKKLIQNCSQTPKIRLFLLNSNNLVLFRLEIKTETKCMPLFYYEVELNSIWVECQNCISVGQPEEASSRISKEDAEQEHRGTGAFIYM